MPASPTPSSSTTSTAASETVTCGPLVAGGDSLVRRPEQKVLFVDGGLPGEQVEVEITRERKDLANARVTKVIERSPARIDPPCPLFAAGCGGCQWQHASADAQHEYKTGIVVDALRRIAKIDDPTVRFGGAVPGFGYRTTLRVAISHGRAALRKRQSNELVPLDTCPIAHPRVAELAVEGRFGRAKEVTLRAGIAGGERLALVDGDASGVHLPADVMVTETGKGSHLHEDVLGRRYRVAAKSFFQSGPAAAELLARTVDAAMPDDIDWVVDAYAGVGVLGGTVAATRDIKLTAIEQHPNAVANAEFNLRDLSQVDVIEAEVAEVELDGIDRPDVVIADPARSGLGPSASRTLAGLRASRLVLVSCDPASLARDTNLLREQGYQLQGVTVLDLFPQTHHVETVTVFDR